MENSSADKEPVPFKKKLWIAGGIFSFIILSLLLFKAIFSVLLLVFAGVLIAIYFYGVAGLFQRYFHWPAKLSIILSVVLNILLLAGFFWFIGARIQQQVAQLSDTLPATIENAKTRIGENPVGRKLLEKYGSSGNSSKTLAAAGSFFSSSFGILSDLYIVILLALFFTASPGLYRKGIISLLPVKAKEKGDEVLTKIRGILTKWLKGQIIGIFVIAILTGIGLLIIGMPLVLTLSLTAGLLNFIPNFGPVIALVPAVLIAFMQGTTTALIVAGMYTLVQIFQSAVSQPLVQKKMANIPPALTIVAQVGMGTLGGFWGVLLATPTIAILMVIVQELYVNRQHPPAAKE